MFATSNKTMSYNYYKKFYVPLVFSLNIYLFFGFKKLHVWNNKLK